MCDCAFVTYNKDYLLIYNISNLRNELRVSAMACNPSCISTILRLSCCKTLHVILETSLSTIIYTVVQKNAPTLADYNYDPVQSILIIFSRLFANDHKSCLVVKIFTSPNICCHYTLWSTMLYFALITLLISKNTCFLRVALKRTG